MWLPLVFAMLLGAALNFLLTPGILRLAHQKRWLDQPNHRTVHQQPIPRLGGVGMVVSIVISLLTLWGADLLGFWVWPTGTWSQTTLLVLLGWGVIFLLGVLDDFCQLKAVFKVLIQVLGILLVFAANLTIERIAVPFTDQSISLGFFGPFLTAIWIMVITNAVNLIDGLDGQAGGYAAIALSSLGVYSFLSGLWFSGLLCFLTVAVLLVFLAFNLPPAQIFMGDSGSLMLGYLVAVLPLVGGDKSLFHTSWTLPLALVAFPIADTLASVFRRLREGRSVLSPDKQHTHHKLMALGFSTKKILVMVYGTTLLASSTVVLAGVLPETVGRSVSWWLGMGCLALSLIGLFSLLHYSFRDHHRTPNVHLRASSDSRVK